MVKDLQKKYPGRIPVVFLKSRKTKAKQIENNKSVNLYLEDNSKTRMLFQPDSRLNQIIGVLHKKLKEEGSLDTEKTGIFVTMNGNITPRICKTFFWIFLIFLATRLDTLYACYADEDGFLYMVYSEEDTTGAV